MADKHDWVKGFNDLPPKFRQITEEQFWAKFAGNYFPQEQILKQVYNVPRRHPMCNKSLVLFLYEDRTAIGFVKQSRHGIPSKPDFFFEAMACRHEMVGTTIGKMLTSYKCKHCDYTYTLDSSG